MAEEIKDEFVVNKFLKLKKEKGKTAELCCD